VPKTATDVRVLKRAHSLKMGVRYTVAGVCFITVLGMRYYTQSRQVDDEDIGFKAAAPFPSEKKRLETFSNLSQDYDSKTDHDEWWLGYRSMRRKLVQKARGLTLEVCAGTGRNLKYYPVGECEVVFSDKSKEMLEVLQSKPVARKKIFKQVLEEDACAMSFKDNTFDTVIDTFGLCSIEDPMFALMEMYRVCKPGGKILLLEHGDSSFKPVRRMMEKQLKRHVHIWGCYYNRDILQYVADWMTLCDDLHLDNVKRRHFGTTYLIELRKATENQKKHPGKKTKFEVSRIPKKPTMLFYQTFVDV